MEAGSRISHYVGTSSSRQLVLDQVATSPSEAEKIATEVTQPRAFVVRPLTVSPIIRGSLVISIRRSRVAWRTPARSRTR
jgi:hypothetical protein